MAVTLTPPSYSTPTATDSVPLSVENEPAVHLEGVHRRFGDQIVLDGVDLDLRPGEFVALLGQSGCGKSTLLRAIAGIDRGATGVIDAPAQRAVVFQEHRLLPWKRVWANVALALPRADKHERAITALEEVGLADKAEAWPLTLSGGESQRVALARALVREPELLLLDEPFGALDALTRIKMHRLLRTLCDAHRPTVLLVTHDVDESLSLAERAVVLRDGVIAVDLKVDLDHRADLRRELLTTLGVEP